MIYIKYPIVLAAFAPVLALLFFVVRREFVKIKGKDEKELKRRDLARKYVFISRALIFLLLLGALAVPFTIKEVTVQGTPKLKIFVDNSRSFELFDNAAVSKLQSELENQIPVVTRVVAEGNESAIGDSLLSNIQGNDNVLLISDGNNNKGRSLGDMMLFANMLNATINAVELSPVNKDAAVYIKGPAKTTDDVENKFEVFVNSVGELEYNLLVTVDGDAVLSRKLSGSQKVEFSKTLPVGYHKILAQIVVEDYFPENNAFYKVVKVEPKPKVLFVSKTTSPYNEMMRKLYDSDFETAMPPDIKKYSAVVLNNMGANDVGKVDTLSSYLVDGNGMVVIGGQSSFDKGNYKESLFETLLPVKVGEKEEKRQEAAVVILIDIAGDTSASFRGGSLYTKEDVEKALAISIMDNLRGSDRVAVLAFNNDVYEVSELSRLAGKREELVDKISSLNFFGGTFIPGAIEDSSKILRNEYGNKNIILITDGGSPTNYEYARKFTKDATFTGVTLHTIGVGVDLQTDVKFLKELAELGNGAYFEPSEVQRVKILFQGYEKGKEDEKPPFYLDVLNSHHFITEDVKLTAGISGFNTVIPKGSANSLVVTSSNRPVITVWRYGLGRAAAITTDDGTSWAGEMLTKGNSVILTKTINWAIGDLSRNKEYDVDIQDVYLGEPIIINVKSEKRPVYAGIKFSKLDENLYTATATTTQQGFYDFLETPVAVNYNKEVGSVGFNPELSNLVRLSKGRMFSPDDIGGIIEKVKQDSKRTKIESVSYSWVLLLAALFLFLAEVGIRRLYENKIYK